ncbi:MAG: hypothetical protein K0B81_04425 [Candidatus Cloacimonetes bacterium]|nr:hypothetical protein [Candidatus Cloacimonadota bacterium]
MYNKIRLVNVLLILSILILSSCYLTALTEEQLKTWLLPPPQEQLDREAKRDLVGLGRVFLPSMTHPDYEPFYLLDSTFDNRQYFNKMGESTYLRPGDYILHYGSGNENQMMRKRITVIREHVHIVEPDWGGLRVRLIDESRNSIDIQYELFAMINAESYGFGIGALEEFGEQPQTWILQPGRYKIVLNNKPFNTIDDFTTVDLVEGELRILTVVVNSETNSLIGAGLLETVEYGKETRNLRFTSAIHGNLSFMMDNSTDREKPTMNLIVTTQLDNRLLFDLYPYFYTMNNLTDFGISKDRGSILRVSSDNFQIRNTFVYYLSQVIGLYSRFDMETHFFQQYDYFLEMRNIRLIDDQGIIIEELFDRDKFRTTPSFFPVMFREGAGFTIRPLNRPRATLNFRAGFGMQQEIMNDVYRFIRTEVDTLDNETEYNVYKIMDSTYKEGLELSILANLFTRYNISYNTTVDVLIPFDQAVSNTYKWENTLTFRFIRQLALDYKINFSYDKDRRDYTEITHNVFLRLTYFIY